MHVRCVHFSSRLGMFLLRSFPSNFRSVPQRISLTRTPTPLRRHRYLSASNELDRVMVDPPPPPPIEIPVFCPGCGIRLQDHSLNRPGFYRVPKTQIETPEAIVCERCYSLTHYGRLKSQDAEKLIPHFNVETVLKPKLLKTKGKKLVIICVVDLFDFDASLPLKELRSLFLESSPFYLDLLIVGNKFDLLPKSLSKESVEIWVRTRLREHRLNAVKDVHLISSQTLQGVRELMTGLKNRIKRNTDCYIIGMQNAGKSSMLNALTQVFDKDSKDRKTDLVTAAFLPGTTLGFVKVTGFPVGKSCRVFDTPGLLQRTQVTSRLNLEELKLVQPRRMLKPRTYRFGTGNSLLIGGLVRLDLTSCPGRTLYVTIWVADMLTCYLGKTENVELKLQKHTGEKLVPPLKMLSDQDSGFELLPRTVRVSGDSWKGASTDICIGGLGWVAVGCQGDAEFEVWTWEGIQVKTRPALIKNFAFDFQTPGFSDSVK